MMPQGLGDLSIREQQQEHPVAVEKLAAEESLVTASASSSSTSLSSLSNRALSLLPGVSSSEEVGVMGVVEHDHHQIDRRQKARHHHDPQQQQPAPGDQPSCSSVVSTVNIPRRNSKVGRWGTDEKLLFLYGLRKFGKGRWKKMSIFLPNRSLVQIKSHGQKVLKRLCDGEDVFCRLPASVDRLMVLLHQLGRTFESDVIHSPLIHLQIGQRRKEQILRSDYHGSQKAGAPAVAQQQQQREHIVAASALCQLATPSVEERDAAGAAVAL